MKPDTTTIHHPDHGRVEWVEKYYQNAIGRIEEVLKRHTTTVIQVWQEGGMMSKNRPIIDLGTVIVRKDGPTAITLLAGSELADGAYVPPQHVWINDAPGLRDWLNEQFPKEEHNGTN